MTMGGDQELVVRLRSRSGQVWGALALYRDPGRPLFDTAEKDFLISVSSHLAEGAWRALLLGEATDPEGVDAPGLLILNDRWRVLPAGRSHACNSVPVAPAHRLRRALRVEAVALRCWPERLIR
jgi:hypothetical protein